MLSRHGHFLRTYVVSGVEAYVRFPATQRCNKFWVVGSVLGWALVMSHRVREAKLRVRDFWRKRLHAVFLFLHAELSVTLQHNLRHEFGTKIVGCGQSRWTESAWAFNFFPCMLPISLNQAQFALLIWWRVSWVTADQPGRTRVEVVRCGWTLNLSHSIGWRTTEAIWNARFD
jgi:hypothetical protein